MTCFPSITRFITAFAIGGLALGTGPSAAQPNTDTHGTGVVPHIAVLPWADHNIRTPGFGTSSGVIQNGFSNQAITCGETADGSMRCGTIGGIVIQNWNTTAPPRPAPGMGTGFQWPAEPSTSFGGSGNIAIGTVPADQGMDLAPLIIPETAVRNLTRQRSAAPDSPPAAKRDAIRHQQGVSDFRAGDLILTVLHAADQVNAIQFCNMFLINMRLADATTADCTGTAFAMAATHQLTGDEGKILIAVERTTHSPPTFRVYVAGNSELISGENGRAEVFDYQVHLTFDIRGNPNYFAIPHLHDFYPASRVTRVTGPRLHVLRGERVPPEVEESIRREMVRAYRDAIQDVIFRFSQ